MRSKFLFCLLMIAASAAHSYELTSDFFNGSVESFIRAHSECRSNSNSNHVRGEYESKSEFASRVSRLKTSCATFENAAVKIRSKVILKYDVDNEKFNFRVATFAFNNPKYIPVRMEGMFNHNFGQLKLGYYNRDNGFSTSVSGQSWKYFSTRCNFPKSRYLSEYFFATSIDECEMRHTVIHHSGQRLTSEPEISSFYLHSKLPKAKRLKSLESTLEWVIDANVVYEKVNKARYKHVIYIKKLTLIGGTNREKLFEINSI